MNIINSKQGGGFKLLHIDETENQFKQTILDPR